MICVVVSKNKKECVLWHLLISVESIEEAHKARERERERERRRRSHTKKGIKLSQKKRFLTYDLGFRVLLKPAKIAPFFMSFSFALT